MPLKKHDRVYHKGLETQGVVLDVLKSGAYRVAVGNLSVECHESDLTPLKKGQGLPKPTISKKKERERAAKRGGPRSISVDLHGMRVDEALSLVERKVNEAILGGCDALEIIHGLGTGRVKSAVHRYLSTLPVVKRFKLVEDNPGTTFAYF